MDNTIDNTFESANRVYDTNGVSPAMNTCGGGGLQPKICEVKKLEVNEIGYVENGTGKHQSNTVFSTDGISQTITTIQGGGTQQIKILEKSSVKTINPSFRDFIYEIDGELYLIRIRKLIPKECWRLMNFSDTDYEKAERVNSQTQLYKEAGNSIVKAVLMAIMSQLNIDGVIPWNELSVEERIDTIEQSQKTDAESETGRAE